MCIYYESQETNKKNKTKNVNFILNGSADIHVLLHKSFKTGNFSGFSKFNNQGKIWNNCVNYFY